MSEFENLTEDDFVARFRPVTNHMEPNGAAFDLGTGGLLFETFGEQLAYVRAQPSDRVWTVVDDGSSTAIVSGMRFVNRLGYVITAEPYPDDVDVEVQLDTDDLDYGEDGEDD